MTPELSDELGDGGLLSAPHFYWGCCMLCRLAATDEKPLKRCSRCSAIFYCSVEHQKKHWKKHKRLCNYISNASASAESDTFFSAFDSSKIDWKTFRVNAVRTAEVILSSQLEEWEKEMFIFPRVCRKCKNEKKEGMIECRDCMGVAYCSQECREEDLEWHIGKGMCEELRFAMACDNFECTLSIAAPPIPAEIDTEYSFDKIVDIKTFLKTVNEHELSGLAEMEQRFLSDRLSGPLTILHVASKFGLAQGKSLRECQDLVIHIVGANVIEMLGLIKWEYIMHRLPKCQTLRLVFVGLELENEEDGECEGIQECVDCSDKGRSVVYDMRCMKYEEYKKSGDYKVPDLIAAFNCGFHEFDYDPSKDTWKSSLPDLVSHSGTPLLFTSYNKTEAQKDLKCILNTGKNVRVAIEGKLNPFRSMRPIRDFEQDRNYDIFYNNQFYSVVVSK